jgi:hypothetical protein
MTHTDIVLAIEKYMSTQCASALTYFCELNPNWKGAHWAGILVNLMETDSHPDITEFVYSCVKPIASVDELHWSTPVALTLTYSNHGAPALPEMVLYWMGYIAGRLELKDEI